MDAHETSKIAGFARSSPIPSTIHFHLETMDGGEKKGHQR